MNEPLRKHYSREEALEFAKNWMFQEYGIPKLMTYESRDRFHEKLGLIVNLLTNMFPTE